jgi:xanthine dehydrogenase molybdopterin-binding subunit B
MLHLSIFIFKTFFFVPPGILKHLLDAILGSFTGEAVYVDDIPVPKDCLYGAFIYSTHPHARINGIKFRSSLASQKVIAVIDAKDIPSSGDNMCSNFRMVDDEPLFANSVSEFAGQNVAIVVCLNHFNFLAYEVSLYIDPIF